MNALNRPLKILIIDNHVELVKQIEARLSCEEDFDVCMVAPLERSNRKPDRL